MNDFFFFFFTGIHNVSILSDFSNKKSKNYLNYWDRYPGGIPDYELDWFDPHGNPFDLFNDRMNLHKRMQNRMELINAINRLGSDLKTPPKEDKTSTLVARILSSTNSHTTEKSSEAYETSTFSSEHTTKENDIQHSVSHNNQIRNVHSAKDIIQSPNIKTQEDIGETNDNTEINSTESTIGNQTAVPEINTTSNSSTSPLENHLNSSVSDFNITEIVSDSSSKDYEPVSTVNVENSTANQGTRSKTVSNSGATSTVFDFTPERTKASSSFETKSTMVGNKDFDTTDKVEWPIRKEDEPESLHKSTIDSASTNFYSSRRPSASHRITEGTTNRRLTVSDYQGETSSGTELPENSILAQPEKVIEIQGIRTLKIVVTVVFMVIAFVAGAVLIVFVCKVKRQEVQYDQLVLIP